MKKIISFLFYLYSLFVVLFPAADFLVSKKLIFALLVCICLIVFLLNYNKKIYVFNLFRILIIFIVLLLGTLFSINDEHSNYIFLIASCVPLLLILLLDNSIDYLNVIKHVGLCLSLIVVISVFATFVSNSFVKRIQTLFLALDSGFWGTRQFGSINLFMIHFRTSPILIIPFSLYFIEYCDNKKISSFIYLFILGMGILFSASRGLILFSYISLLLICLCNMRLKTYRHFFFLLTIVAILGLLFLLTSTNVFDTKEKSNSIKINHIISFYELISEQPHILLIGNGTGSSYYTSGFNCITWQTEVTFLDMVRYWGIIGTVIVMFCFLYNKNKSLSKTYVIPFVLYVISAALNPLIFNSTGMLVLTIYILLTSNTGKKHSENLQNNCYIQ